MLTDIFYVGRFRKWQSFQQVKGRLLQREKALVVQAICKG